MRVSSRAGRHPSVNAFKFQLVTSKSHPGGALPSFGLRKNREKKSSRAGRHPSVNAFKFQLVTSKSHPGGALPSFGLRKKSRKKEL